MRSGSFTLKMIGFLTPLLLVLFAVIGLAMYTGEALPLRLVIAAQQRDPDAIYLPFDPNMVFAYKRMMLQAHQPEVLLVGSSRVLSFQSAFFTKNPAAFYNAGGSGWQQPEITTLLEAIDPQHPPKILLLDVEFYWFNPRWTGFDTPVDRTVGELPPERILLDTRQVMQQLFDQKITVDQVLHPFEPVYGSRAFGLEAITTGRGYKQDGSRQTNVLLLPPAQQNGMRMIHLQYLHDEVAGYISGTTVSKQALDRVELVLQEAQALGIQVVGLMPPLLTPVYNGIRDNPKYSYFPAAIRAVEALFARYRVPFFDFNDLSTVGGSDQEMIDGIHPSELLSLRMIIAMQQALPALFGNYADLKVLEDAAAHAPNPHEVFRQNPVRP